MYDTKVGNIHLEITSKCNARCPQCIRNFHNSPHTDPTLPEEELSLDELIKILDDPMFSDVYAININGVYGDIVMHSDPLPLLQEILRRNIYINLHTNGSGLSKHFWEEIGKLQLHVVFALDGLADTHHLYRRNTRFDITLANAETFINNGGTAVWQFIVFKHNKHQVDEARELAKEKGFIKFVEIMSSNRFLPEYNAISIKDKDFEHSYYLEREDTIDEELKVHPMRNIDDTREAYSNPPTPGRPVGKPYPRTEAIPDEIVCDVANGSLYISYDKRLWPCCFIAPAFDSAHRGGWNNNLHLLFKEQLDKDYDFNNIIKRSVGEIMDDTNNFRVVSDEWTKTTLCDVCNQQCAADGIWTLNKASQKGWHEEISTTE